MEEYTQITLDQWVQWKEDIRRKLQETAGNFVYIGYRLKQIRDSGMYDGCADIFEFARKEYGLTESTVSRFISINEQYSEGGNSLELREEYRGLNYSVLSEMLTLPEQDRQLITSNTTVKDVRELKRFGRQEPDVAAGTEESEYTPLQKCIIDYFRDKKDRLDGAMDALNDWDLKTAAEKINPGGNATHKKGIIFLFLYDFENGVKYKSLMEVKPVVMTWDEFCEEVIKIYGAYYLENASVWSEFYEKPEENQTVATSQEAEENVGKVEEESAVATSQETEKNDTKQEVKKEKKTERNSTVEAGVPEEIGPEKLPKGDKWNKESWKEPEKKEHRPVKLPQADAQYNYPVGETIAKEIRGGLRFLILRTKDPYRVGNTVHLLEHKDGEETGEVLDIKITYLVDDHGGLTPGYVALQFELLPPAEKQIPGQMTIGEMNEQENQDEAGEKTGIYSEGPESDT